MSDEPEVTKEDVYPASVEVRYADSRGNQKTCLRENRDGWTRNGSISVQLAGWIPDRVADFVAERLLDTPLYARYYGEKTTLKLNEQTGEWVVVN